MSGQLRVIETTGDPDHRGYMIRDDGGMLGFVRKDLPNASVNANMFAAALEMFKALTMITSNKFVNLEDLIYRVRELECEGWDGEQVKQWAEACRSVKSAIAKAKGNL